MNDDAVHLQPALKVLRYLETHSILPVLYGSLGASLYLGAFKNFGDIDFLVPKEWLAEKWPMLLDIMDQAGFKLIDDHEHEFQHSDGRIVAFAEEDVLIRDNILDSLDQLTTQNVDNLPVRTLRPEDFKKAYEYSEKDGYRKARRGKSDRTVIELLDNYLATDR
jgi:hypothetical protein